MTEIIIESGLRLNKPILFRTQLSLCVQKKKKNISSGNAPIHFAIVSRASFNAFLVARENEYGCDGFPYSSSRNGFIASKADKLNFVVAALSA